jgi:acetyltransferase-like isoleucine patch superfamily enzyme
MTERLAGHLQRLYRSLRRRMKLRHDRHVALGDLCTDRWETARFLGFGEGSSCYDNVLILGSVRVGCHTWIGPNVVLDGSGDLDIGDYCSISAGVQIYTHHTVAWATSLGQAPVERRPTRIGSGVYIGPNAVIAMGVTVGDRVVIGAMSFVNRDVPDGAKVYGSPAR